jgi:hypothetical protein
MPGRTGGLQRDPLSRHYDGWARLVLRQLQAGPWEWHTRWVYGPPGPADRGGLTHPERAAQRSLWWCLGHAASSGIRIRPEWSLQVAWGEPEQLGSGLRRRPLRARLTPRDAGRRAVLLGLVPSYVTHPTSRGRLAGEGWQPKGPPG